MLFPILSFFGINIKPKAEAYILVPVRKTLVNSDGSLLSIN
jgi:hypothetical protein